jgi:NAD(P)H-dependent FMN reductase
MANLRIPVLLGTGRDDRRSAAPAAYVAARLAAYGVDSELFDVREVATAMTHHSSQVSDRTARWREVMAESDGLVIVAPEYNHGYPGELKIVLDALYDEYARKPVSICGVSSGPMGGVRCVEQLRQVAVELRMVPTRNAVYFSNVKTLFDGDGAITDPAYDARLQAMFDELAWYARALSAARIADPPRK